MNIVVCIKKVPDTSDASAAIAIGESGKDIIKNRLVYKLNSWDEYALEEAIQLKEKSGGRVVVITAGPDEWNDILRRALAMGADEVIRVDEDLHATDSFTAAKILATLISRLQYDLILFGAQSEDFGDGQLGVMVAEMLGIPHASLVVKFDLQEKEARIRRELEGGTLEQYRIRLPALLTVQSGINQPRYISVLGIKKAMARRLKLISLSELNLSHDTLAPKVSLKKLSVPAKGKNAEIITGSAEETAEGLAKILKNAGVF